MAGPASASPTPGPAAPSLDLPDRRAVGDLDPDEEWDRFLARYESAVTMRITTVLGRPAGQASSVRTYETWTDRGANTAEARLVTVDDGWEGLVKRWVDGSVYLGRLVGGDDDTGVEWVDVTQARPAALGEIGWRLRDDPWGTSWAKLLEAAEPVSALGTEGRRYFVLEVQLKHVGEAMNLVDQEMAVPLDTASLDGTQTLLVGVDATGRNVTVVLDQPPEPLGVPEADELMATAHWSAAIELDPLLPYTVRVPDPVWPSTE